MSFFLEDLEALECQEHGADCPSRHTEAVFQFTCAHHPGAPTAAAYKKGEGELWVACAVCSAQVIRVAVACRDDGRG